MPEKWFSSFFLQRFRKTKKRNNVINITFSQSSKWTKLLNRLGVFTSQKVSSILNKNFYLCTPEKINIPSAGGCDIFFKNETKSWILIQALFFWLCWSLWSWKLQDFTETLKFVKFIDVMLSKIEVDCLKYSWQKLSLILLWVFFSFRNT